MTPQSGSIEKLDLAAYSDAPIFNTKAVVQQTGVPAPTLRAWERRYKILSPERANNTYRLYTERDIATVLWLKRRVDAGMAISQAVALFRLKSDEQPIQAEGNGDVQHGIVSHEVLQPLVEHTQFPATSNEPQFDKEFAQSSLAYGMHTVRERLVAAFIQLDEAVADTIIGSMMAIYPLEQVCSELITPTMWRIGQLWADGMISVSVEHFACNFFRALFTNLLHVTPVATRGPLAIVCCAPGESHELAPLMLSLFLRRDGMRIVYLGQNIESKDLLQTVRQLAPTLLCVSVTMPAYLAGMLDLAHRVEALQPPRPLFAFGGQGVAYTPDIISHIPGVYLSGSLKEIVVQLHSVVVKQIENKN